MTKSGFNLFWFILCCNVFCYGCMFAFVVFVSVFSFSILSQQIGWEVTYFVSSGM